MDFFLTPKTSASEGVLFSSTVQREFIEDDRMSLKTPYEIFRNNTTAVEVIVKEITHKGKKIASTNVHKAKANRSNSDIEKLRSKLDKANSNLDEARKCFKVILCEMKKQLEAANQRELKTQTNNLALQLEKEKLRTSLESKSNLVKKLKKELLSMRRMLKVVVRGIRNAPQFPETIYHSSAEYEEFEKELQNGEFIAVAANTIDEDSAIKSFMSNKI